MTIADLATLTRALGDATSTSLPDATFLIYFNAAYEDVVGQILLRDGTWQFDDRNYTDRPVGRTNLVASQRDYSFDSSVLLIEEADVLDNSGNWQKLIPIDKTQYSEPLDEIYEVAGLPEYYDKEGDSLLLYPAPASGSVTLTNGLRVHFQRTASIFTSAELTTGTKLPGIVLPWHSLLAYKAVLPYCLTYKKDRIPVILREIDRMEKSIHEFYGQREKDKRKVMSNAGISHI